MSEASDPRKHSRTSSRLQVTDRLIREQIMRVAPAVAQMTGWDLGLDSLGCRVVPKDQGYEELVLGRLGQTGIQDAQALMPGLLGRLVEYLVEQNALAAYMPGAGEVLVLRENVDDSNLDGLGLVLAHELVHRGQHLAHGGLFARVDDLTRQAVAYLRSPEPQLDQIMRVMDEIKPIMTLLESHAAHVQGRIQQAYFPAARIESHVNVATLLMRLIGAGKVAQYTEGLPQVAAAASSGGVDSLFRQMGA